MRAFDEERTWEKWEVRLLQRVERTELRREALYDRLFSSAPFLHDPAHSSRWQICCLQSEEPGEP